MILEENPKDKTDNENKKWLPVQKFVFFQKYLFDMKIPHKYFKTLQNLIYSLYKRKIAEKFSTIVIISFKF